MLALFPDSSWYRSRKLICGQKQRERDHAVKESVLSKMGFVNEGKEGDAY